MQYRVGVDQGFKKPGFLKKAQPSGFLGVLLGFWVLLGCFAQAGKNR